MLGETFNLSWTTPRRATRSRVYRIHSPDCSQADLRLRVGHRAVDWTRSVRYRSFYRIAPFREVPAKEPSVKGYVTTKRGRYYAVIYEGLDPVTGRERRTWHPAGTDRAEAERLARESNGRNDDVRSLTFERIARRAGVPVIRLHDLRHTHGTLLIKDLVPVKVVSERLGHANIAFTIETYQHVLPGMQSAAARTFEALVAQGQPSPGPTQTG